MLHEAFAFPLKNDILYFQVHNILGILPVLDPDHYHHRHLPEDSLVPQGKETQSS